MSKADGTVAQSSLSEKQEKAVKVRGCDVAVITGAGYRFMFAELLQWILETWGDRRPALSIEITARQELEAAALENCGFERAHSFYTSRFDLTDELAGRTPLEVGFVIVDMHGHPDYRAQHLLRLDAFQNKTEVPEEETDRLLGLYACARESPLYHPQTDLCVMAPDGTLVSGCEALVDAQNAEADIERVCTRSGYRRRGFARAVIQECLYRLRDIGLRRAFITGYSPEALALYGSLGAQERTESLVYKQIKA